MFPNYYCKEKSQFYKKDQNSLTCEDTNVPVKDGIPRFVVNDNYAAAFGEQWKKYFNIQLDSYTKTSISKNRTRNCCGHDLFDNLKGKYVLEAGCGAGRFTEVLLNQGANVMSFDLSDAVDANVQNFPLNEKHQIFQGDINKIPFEENQFDVVICLGVIQHTPDSELSIASLYKYVKPGGWLVIDHYTYKLSHFTKTTELIRPFLKRLSPDKGIKATEAITNFFFPMHKAVRKIYPLQALLSRISPVHSYYFAYPELSDEDQYNWAKLDTHDSLTDWYKRFRTKGQIKETLQQLGGVNIFSEYSGHGVDARCQKPMI